MNVTISKKAKGLAKAIAFAVALSIGALAAAAVLFFSAWWAGLIALAVSMLFGGVAALFFAAYRAERRKRLTCAEAEENAMLSSLVADGEKDGVPRKAIYPEAEDCQEGAENQ